MTAVYPILVATVLLTSWQAHAEPAGEADSTEATTEPRDRTFLLGLANTGIGFGNHRRLNGIRINARDRAVEQVNGVNLTLWMPRQNPHLTVNGLALGLVGPAASSIRGVGIGPGVVTDGGSLYGVGIGLFGLVSDHGNIGGIGMGGLAIVSDHGNLTGLNLAGLAIVSDHGSIRGINLSGLALVSDNGRIWGINAAGLALVTDNGSVTGVSLSGMATVSDEISGIHGSGLVLLSEGGAIRGLNVAGGLVASDHGTISGLAVGGAGVMTDKGSIRGIAVGGALLPFAVTGKWIGNGWVQNANRALIGAGLIALGGSVYSPDIHGLAIGIANGIHNDDFDRFPITERFAGVSIGILNFARHLRGVQIGLLNYAGNNPAPFRLLPFVNLNLRS